ncbi:hypothetical protein LCGC14_0589250 [marine sediment metagenome]|uniref:Uncharacterized protein n=1 Tax=marine sediment metagenome TaxID=412755 RepID=A0A0F9UMF2_9ZZZZ
MPLFNISNATSTINFLELAQEINILSSGVFGIMFLITIGSLMFLTIRVRTDIDNNVLIAATMWFMAIFATLFRAMDIVNNEVLIVVLVGAIASVGLLWARAD